MPSRRNWIRCLVVNSEAHVLGLWIGGGVTPSALEMIETALLRYIDGDTVQCMPEQMELMNMANACRAQLQKLPKPDPARYL